MASRLVLEMIMLSSVTPAVAYSVRTVSVIYMKGESLRWGPKPKLRREMSKLAASTRSAKPMCWPATTVFAFSDGG